MPLERGGSGPPGLACLWLTSRRGGAHSTAQTQTSSTGSATRLRRGARSHPGTHTHFPQYAHSPGVSVHITRDRTPVEPELDHGPAGALTGVWNRASSVSRARAPVCLPGAGRVATPRAPGPARPPPSLRLRDLQAAHPHLAGLWSSRCAPTGLPSARATAGTHVPESLARPAQLPTPPGQAGGGPDSRTEIGRAHV